MKTEKRLIDANWILGEIEHDIGCYEIGEMTEDYALYVELRDVVKMVCAAPTVDAVEVVRCKDCKHWLKDVPGCTDFVGRCEWANYMVGAVGYCVYGERKDNES